MCVGRAWGGWGGGGEHINLKRWVGMSESEVWKAQESGEWRVRDTQSERWVGFRGVE